jgi:histidinol-phosphate/aromatic aminotransferase/cobyric acid decarboxylase-like protein
MPGCAGCLRITIGTPEENRRIIEALRSMEAGS